MGFFQKEANKPFFSAEFDGEEADPSINLNKSSVLVEPSLGLSSRMCAMPTGSGFGIQVLIDYKSPTTFSSLFGGFMKLSKIRGGLSTHKTVVFVVMFLEVV